MPKTPFVSLLWFFAAILITSNATAQSEADSASNGHKLYAHIEDDFYTKIGPQSRLYNGERYEFYDPAIKGNPYFMLAADWNPGTIVYDGFTYKNVSIRYDLYKDMLVIPLYKSFLKMSLINEKVTSFDVLGHHFIYIKTGTSINAGFYDELYGGRIKFLCKHDISIQTEHTFNGGIDSYFLPAIDYYIYKDGEYTAVNSKGTFLTVLKDKRKSLLQYIRANKLKFNKTDKERAMVALTAYYDHLTN
jgi:hypothetical protein